MKRGHTKSGSAVGLGVFGMFPEGVQDFGDVAHGVGDGAAEAGAFDFGHS